MRAIGIASWYSDELSAKNPVQAPPAQNQIADQQKKNCQFSDNFGIQARSMPTTLSA